MLPLEMQIFVNHVYRLMKLHGDCLNSDKFQLLEMIKVQIS